MVKHMYGQRLRPKAIGADRVQEELEGPDFDAAFSPEFSLAKIDENPPDNMRKFADRSQPGQKVRRVT